MKRIIALALACILCCATVPGLASSVDLSTMTDDELRQLRSDIDVELSARSTASLLAGGVLLEGDLGNYHVALTNIERATGTGGAPCVILTFVFTNNSADANSFTLAIGKTVYQNGVQCTNAYFTTPSADATKALLDVKDGASIEVQSAYELYDAESPIEIELNELFNWASNAPTLIGTFSLPE